MNKRRPALLPADLRQTHRTHCSHGHRVNCDRFFPRQRSRTNPHHPSRMRNWLATPGRGLQGPGRVAPCATSCAPEETFTRHNTHRQCPESDTTDPPMHRTWDPQQNARPSPELCQWLGLCIRHPVACSLQLTVHRLGSAVPHGVWHLGKPSAQGERQTTHAERQPGPVHPRSTELIRGWGSTKSHPYLLRACWAESDTDGDAQAQFGCGPCQLPSWRR